MNYIAFLSEFSTVIPNEKINIRLLLTPFVNEIIGGYRCGFIRNMSTIDHIFFIWQILDIKRNVMEQYICRSWILRKPMMKWEVLYNILIEFEIRNKLFILIKLHKVSSRICTGKHLYVWFFSIHYGLKQGNVLSRLPFIYFALEYVINEVQHNQEGIDLNRLNPLHVYVDSGRLLEQNRPILTMNKKICPACQ